jgi:hypothetical protein
MKDQVNTRIAASREGIARNLFSIAVVGVLTAFGLMNLWVGAGFGSLLLLGIALHLRNIRKLRKIMSNPLFYLLAVKEAFGQE